MKKFLVGFVVLSLVAVLLAACGGGGNSGSSSSNSSSSNSSSSSSSSAPTVHMGATNFTQSSITINKGQSITLVDDQNVTHIISNGSWDNGTAKPATESGAPTVHDLTFNSSGQSQTVGPFNTSGTYHLYCSVHVGMNLTITVQ